MVKETVKVKCTLVQALRLCTDRMAHRGSRGTALLFLDHRTRRGWGVSITPRPLLCPGKTQYPLYRRLGGPQGRSGQVRKISPQPGFNPWTAQPIVSRNTDCATWPVMVKEVRVYSWKMSDIQRVKHIEGEDKSLSGCTCSGIAECVFGSDLAAMRPTTILIICTFILH